MKLQITGKFTITNSAGEEVLRADNDVNKLNVSACIARALSSASPNQDGSSTSSIFKVKLGNGGTVVSNGVVLFQPPNTASANGTLYNEVKSLLVDESFSATPTTNSVVYSIIDTKVIFTISAVVPVGETFTFDEIGLFTSNDELLTHSIFTPTLKPLTEEQRVNYTLTIVVI